MSYEQDINQSLEEMKRVTRSQTATIEVSSKPKILMKGIRKVARVQPESEDQGQERPTISSTAAASSSKRQREEEPDKPDEDNASEAQRGTTPTRDREGVKGAGSTPPELPASPPATRAASEKKKGRATDQDVIGEYPSQPHPIESDWLLGPAPLSRDRRP